MVIRDSAFVLKKILYKETSLILNVLSRAGGLQSFLVKGALRQKSPFFGMIEFLNEVEIHYYKKENTTLYTLNKAELVRDHFALSMTPDTLMAIGELVQYTRRNIPFNEPVPALFQSFSFLLRGVEEKKENKALLYYFLTLLQEMGLPLKLTGRCSCGETERSFFNPEEGAFSCSRCRKGIFVGSKMADDLTALASHRGKNIEISAKEAKDYMDILKEYMKYHK
ncbi:MAG TPA: DNA repair protein RecO [Candidatus Mcinerneyibacteriales bacterium]|nr:DNA repair protein RecO [Candidatus Mcinerneyibacteriales bacterium]